MAILPLIALGALLLLWSRSSSAANIPPPVTVSEPGKVPAQLAEQAEELRPLVASADTPAEMAAAAAAVALASVRDWPAAIAQAVASGDARAVETVAAAMRADSMPEEAATVQAVADMLRQEAIAANEALALQVSAKEVKALESPVALPPESPAQQAAKALAAYIATATRYKEDRNRVAGYQTALGVGADGKYGPVSASALVPFGIIPPAPFYWSPTNSAQQIREYSALLRAQAVKDSARAAEWIWAADHCQR